LGGRGLEHGFLRKHMENGTIEKYMDREGFLDRSGVHAADVLTQIWKKNGRRWLQRAYSGSTEGDTGQIRLYDELATPAGEIAAYDILKSHCRSGIIFLFEQAIQLGLTDPSHRVLDIGCGSGLEACFFAEQMKGNGHVEGIDISNEMVKRALERKNRLGLSNVHFLRASRDNLPYEDQAFERIFCNHALTEGNNQSYNQYGAMINRHIIGERIKELRRVLHDKGVALISEPSQPEAVDFTEEYTGSLIEFSGMKIVNVRIKSSPAPVEDQAYSEVCFVVKK